MGYYDALAFLKTAKGEWLSSKEIGERMGVSKSAATRAMFKIKEMGVVKTKMVQQGKHSRAVKYQLRGNC